ncbi:hypothetical protein OUZ56_007147 [Daphnia magna]|uniref:Torsin-1A-interacting protein 1/2 AAA+ activator domain-containing protein n=1 Tax=Daphnia magna TaxID=35525 RepID=A0ABQ9YXW0_9CRUS|nr:hypothetical protein OUZ56_007147 [Daphnia magna]
MEVNPAQDSEITSDSSKQSADEDAISGQSDSTDEITQIFEEKLKLNEPSLVPVDLNSNGNNSPAPNDSSPPQNNASSINAVTLSATIESQGKQTTNVGQEEGRQKQKTVKQSKPANSNPITHDNSKSTSEEVPFPGNKQKTVTPVILMEQKAQSKSQKYQPRLNCTNSLVSLTIVTLLAICLGFIKVDFLLPSFDGWNNKISTSSNTFSHQAMELIDEMQKTFPFQKKGTWISFLSALNSVTEEEPSQPAVLLFVSGNAAMRTMQNIAQTLAINTNKLLHTTNSAKANFQGVTVKVDEIADLLRQDDTIKQELDEQIHSILSQSFSVILGPLEKIPPQAALLLHGYCDNFMAPFKKSVIILTATFDYEIPRNSKEVEQKLHSLWDPTLGIDKSASIVSRVANNVVFIEPETDSTPRNEIGRA